MKKPTVVTFHLPESISCFTPVGKLDVGDLFLISPATEAELCVLTSNPTTGYLHYMNLESGDHYHISRDVLVHGVTAVITVVGDVEV